MDTTPNASETQELQAQLAFQTELNDITQLIHSAASISDILVNLSERIKSLLACERLTIYAIDVKNNLLYSILKQGGGDGPKVIKVARDANSIAGFCALSKNSVSIVDVYDSQELAQIHASLRFDQRWDRAMGFRTKQVLATPLHFQRYILGVLQMINKVGGSTFSALDREAAEKISETLAIAFYNQNRARRATPGRRSKFSDLVDKGMISEKALEGAVTFARVNNKSIGKVLMEEHGVEKEEVGRSLADFYNCTFFFYDGDQRIPNDLTERVRYEFWRKLVCAPISRRGSLLKVVVVDPFDLSQLDTIKSTGIAANMEVVVGLEDDIVDYLNESYGVEDTEVEEDDFAQILTELKDESIGEVEEVEDDEDDLDDEEVQGAVVRLCNKIISDGYRLGVSDIHIEPYGSEAPLKIRFRRDGLCFVYQSVPSSHRSALVSRLKIMAQLDISEKRKPQDGKIRFRLAKGDIIELRVATMPTTGKNNEDVVMRILAASKPLPIDKLGMSPRNLEEFKAITGKPYGLILSVGPTGSGKTTTLHSALGFINKDVRKIWTAEDPVEITQAGLRQVQVRPKIGLTFASCMRSFLRADPDVIMIGEMRDEETAGTGIEASLTGHLVFSTLHTNSAPETVTRLLDMGLDPFNFADAMLGILAQRLVRTLCKTCKEAYHPDEDEFNALREMYGDGWEKLGIEYTDDLQLMRTKGCKSCTDSGYRGRMGLHELMLGTDEIKRLILQRKSVEQIRDTAIDEGMTTLMQDGIWKIFEGYTDFTQVRAVCIR